LNTLPSDLHSHHNPTQLE